MSGRGSHPSRKNTACCSKMYCRRRGGKGFCAPAGSGKRAHCVPGDGTRLPQSSVSRREDATPPPTPGLTVQQEGWEQIPEQDAEHARHLRVPRGLAVVCLGPLLARARVAPVRGALGSSAAAPGGRPPGPASGDGAPHCRWAQRGTAGRALPRRRRAPVCAGFRNTVRPLLVRPRSLGSQPQSRGPPRRTQLGDAVAATAAAAESLHICRAPRKARRRGRGGGGVSMKPRPHIPPLLPLF